MLTFLAHALAFPPSLIHNQRVVKIKDRKFKLGGDLPSVYT